MVYLYSHINWLHLDILHMFLTRQDEEIKLPWLLMTVLVHI